MSFKRTMDKAIKMCDAEVLKNASGTVLGKVITKSGNKYVIEDTYGTKYIVVENDVNWLKSSRKTVPADIRAVALQRTD